MWQRRTMGCPRRIPVKERETTGNFSAGSMARVDALEGGDTPGELLAAIA
jgi:hypothetical protein